MKKKNGTALAQVHSSTSLPNRHRIRDQASCIRKIRNFWVAQNKTGCSSPRAPFMIYVCALATIYMRKSLLITKKERKKYIICITENTQLMIEYHMPDGRKIIHCAQRTTKGAHTIIPKAKPMPRHFGIIIVYSKYVMRCGRFTVSSHVIVCVCPNKTLLSLKNAREEAKKKSSTY